MKRILLVALLAPMGCASPLGVAQARLSIATDGRIKAEDKELFKSAISICRNAGLIPRCYERADSMRPALESPAVAEEDKERLRKAAEKYTKMRLPDPNASRDRFKATYGLDDGDMATLDIGLSICDRLELNRKCLSLLKSEILERTYGSQLSKSEIANFAMAQQIMANVKQADQRRRQQTSEAMRNLQLSVDDFFDRWSYSTTNCSGYGNSINCMTTHR